MARVNEYYFGYAAHCGFNKVLVLDFQFSTAFGSIKMD